VTADPGPPLGHTIAPSQVLLDEPSAAHAVEVAPRIWWVGDVVDDPFQSHAYLVEAGHDSVLIDPGSTLTIDATLAKVREVIDLDDLRYFVVHHADPDVADGLHQIDALVTRDDARIVSEWRSAVLLKHLALRLPLTTVEELGWSLALEGGRELRFLLTPYLHFPGAFVSFESSTSTLFSADLFGGFNGRRRLWADTSAEFEDLRLFHEHYMPSREILMAGLASIRTRFRDIHRVLPQHGYLIRSDLVRPMFEQLAALECGVMLQSRSDEHLAQLLRIAAAVRNIEAVLDATTDLTQAISGAVAHLRTFLPAIEVAIEAEVNGGVVRFGGLERSMGRDVAGWTTASPLRLVLALPGTEGSTRPAQAIVGLSATAALGDEATEMLTALTVRVRRLLETAIEQRSARRLLGRLEDSAYHDSLTGLLNRRYLADRPPRVRRTAALMIDIDHFKDVNDRHGHQAGDVVLRAVTSAIRDSVRTGDLVVRWGGEEILVIVDLRGAEPAALLPELTERIHTTVTTTRFDDLPTAGVTVSIGVAVARPADRFEDLVAAADRALYDAKRNGRDRTEYQQTDAAV